MSSEEANPLEMPDEQRDKISDILQRRKLMPPETCASVRQRKRHGESVQDIATDEDVHWKEQSVRHHVYGHCKHEIETPPVNETGKENSTVSQRECDRMRQLRDDGVATKEIAEKMNRGESTVCDHTNERCPHETDTGEVRE